MVERSTTRSETRRPETQAHPRSSPVFRGVLAYPWGRGSVLEGRVPVKAPGFQACQTGVTMPAWQFTSDVTGIQSGRSPQPSAVSEYERVRPLFVDFVEVCEVLLRNLLEHADIDVLSVEGRAKSVTSAGEKMSRKGYVDPLREMTDLAGVRIIVFLDRDVDRVVEFIRGNFREVAEHATDHRAELGTDKVGYRSSHVIVNLGEERSKLAEYVRFQGLVVEVQVRTVLQHAWADILHDSSYKFPGDLPDELQRKLNLLAGHLETADTMLEEAVDLIAAYVETVEAHLADEESSSGVRIDSTSLGRIAAELLDADLVRALPTTAAGPSLERLAEEVHSFGIATFGELMPLIDAALEHRSAHGLRPTTAVGLIRDAMILADWQRYFAEAWGGRWGNFDDRNEYQALVEVLGDGFAEEIRDRNISVDPD